MKQQEHNNYLQIHCIHVCVQNFLLKISKSACFSSLIIFNQHQNIFT